MVDFLAKCGILPSAVVGHSSGEIAAAYASGALTLPQAILCAHFRGQAMKTVGRTGAMAAVGLSSEMVQQYLVDGAQIACINSPTSVTISGDSTSVDQSLRIIKQKEPEAFTRLLHVKMAYHSGKT
jgi:acyl transferase domain-containing protein